MRVEKSKQATHAFLGNALDQYLGESCSDLAVISPHGLRAVHAMDGNIGIA
jgi:hypothetical protein